MTNKVGKKAVKSRVRQPCNQFGKHKLSTYSFRKFGGCVAGLLIGDCVGNGKVHDQKERKGKKGKKG
jgi:hypothetical protein